MVKVKYFGMVAEAVGRPFEYVEVKTSQLSELIKELYIKYPLNGFALKIAVNQAVVDITKNNTVYGEDEIALLPPFAGG